MHSIVCMYVCTYVPSIPSRNSVCVCWCLFTTPDIFFAQAHTWWYDPGVATWCTFDRPVSWVVGGGTSKSRKAAVGCREKSIPPHDEARLDNATRECLANTRMRIRVVRECIPARELTWSAAFRSPWRMPLTWWVNNQSVAMMTSTTTTIASATNRAVALCPCIPR